MNRKARLLASYLKGRPIWCTWQVTPRCESACAFCDHRAESAALEPDLETARAIVRELSSFGSMIVSLSGGEPFLRPDLAELVAALAPVHFPLLTTDGCLVTRDRARAVWSAGLEAATVRLDHADPVRQDVAAGVPGAHARALAGLRVLSEERTRSSQLVNVKARVTDDAVPDLPDLLRLAAEHQATVTVEPAFPLVPEAGRRSRLAEKLRGLRSVHPNLRAGRHFLSNVDEALDRGVGECRAGRAFFNVDHHGRVSKCVEFRRPEDRAGRLPDQGIGVVAEALRRKSAPNECRACFYAYRAEVEGLYTVGGFLRAIPDLVRA